MKTNMILALTVLVAMPAFAQQYKFVGTREMANNQYQAEDDPNQDVEMPKYVRATKPRSNVKTVKAYKNIKTAARYYNPKASNVRAEGQTVGAVSTWDTEAEFHNRISIDLAPLINEGIGASYERVFFSKFTLGAYGSMFKMKDSKSNELGEKNDLTAFGMKARYFLNGNADESSFYIMGGAQSTTLKTEVDANRVLRKKFQDEGQGWMANQYMYSQEKKMTREISEIGGVVGAGYQVALNAMGSTGFLIDLGGFYGHGNAMKYEVKTINNGTQTELRNEIKYDFFGELNVGLMF